MRREAVKGIVQMGSAMKTEARDGYPGEILIGTVKV